MPRGKRSKQQRRVPAPPPVKGSPRSARRASPTVLIAVGAVVVLAAIGVGIGLAVTGGSSSSNANVPSVGSLTNALPAASDVNTQLKGIPQNGNVLGKPSAPVTMVEYVDLQCPYCQQFETQVMPDLIKTYVRTGKVKVEARVLAFIGGDSERGRKAALAAAQQNRMFDFMELLYYNQGAENTGWLDDKMVSAAAASIPGLQVHRLLDAMNGSSIKQREQAFEADATADKVVSTPTLLVGKTGKNLSRVNISSPTDKQSVVNAIETALG